MTEQDFWDSIYTGRFLAGDPHDVAVRKADAAIVARRERTYVPPDQRIKTAADLERERAREFERDLYGD